MKILFILGLIALILWFFFFKKRPQSKDSNQSTAMVECKQCKTFISQDEAILSNGAYFCSKTCLLKG